MSFSETAANTDPILMERLASRQLNLHRPDQETLVLDPAAPYRDHSVETLLAESLTPTTPVAVAALPAPLEATMKPEIRRMLVILVCGGDKSSQTKDIKTAKQLARDVEV